MSVWLKNVSKNFATERGTVRAVRDLTLHIETGEFFSLLGPSGCGKTTTIRCLAGLEHPDEGEIFLGDQMVFSRGRNQMVPVHQRL
jgi:iron(III) transport system ATP-binding protein